MFYQKCAMHLENSSERWCDMKLTEADWAYVKSLYGDEKAFHEDKRQIMEAVEKTRYYRYKDNNDVYSKEIPLTRAGVIRLLGRETWLGGIVRSAFHWTAAREDDKGRTIFFDSRELFAD